MTPELLVESTFRLESAAVKQALVKALKAPVGISSLFGLMNSIVETYSAALNPSHVFYSGPSLTPAASFVAAQSSRPMTVRTIRHTEVGGMIEKTMSAAAKNTADDAMTLLAAHLDVLMRQLGMPYSGNKVLADLLRTYRELRAR